MAAHRINYWLGLCSTDDNVDGSMGGMVWGSGVRTVLDAGKIVVWTESGRTHVEADKTFQADSSAVNWLSQMNPALRELNDQLGEMACCF